MNENGMSKHDHVLAGLVYSLQAAVMQQLGKLQDPVSGQVTTDLEQARATIDVLEMLKVKCRQDTPEVLLRMLDGAVMDLQLNYMDEMKKSAASGAAAEATDEDADAAEPGTTDAPEDPAETQDDDKDDA